MSSGQKAHAEEVEQQQRERRLALFKMRYTMDMSIWELLNRIDEIQNTLERCNFSNTPLTRHQHEQVKNLERLIEELP